MEVSSSSVSRGGQKRVWSLWRHLDLRVNTLVILSLESVKFTIAFSLCRDAVEVFILLEPELNGVVHGDLDCSGAPGICVSIFGSVGKKELFPFLRDVTCEEMLPSQLSLLQDRFAM